MKIREKIKRFIWRYWRLIVVIIVAGLFFVGTSGYHYYTHEYSETGDFVKWSSPDESANYVFAKLYGQTGSLTIQEKFNSEVKGIMHPRSIRSDGEELKPVSFLGIILIYGKIVSLTNYKILPYLTPFFGALGIIFFYLLIKRIFNRSNAFWSAILLATFPPYIYYSIRSMFHNVLFTVLLIIGLYYAVSMIGRKKWYWQHSCAALGGAAIGLAIITRTSELIWLAPLLLLAWLFNIRKVGVYKLITFVSFVVIAMIPMFYYNFTLYGGVINSGYPAMNESLVEIAQASTEMFKSTGSGEISIARAEIDKIFSKIFFFGFHPKQSLKMLNYYLAEMFPWLFWGALAGMLTYAIRKKYWKARQWIFISGLVLVSCILVFYYGSWEFFDNPDKAAHTIGNSYTRYWLPIYLGLIPFAVLLVMRLSRAVCALLKPIIKKPKDIKKFFSPFLTKRTCLLFLRSIAVLIITYISISYVLYGSDEGVIYQYQKQMAVKHEWQRVIRETESNAAIITLYHDKLFFPERKVIIGLFDDKNMIAEYVKLVEIMPVYYYNFSFPERDIKYLNERRLPEFGLQIREVEKVTGDFSLYKLEKVVPIIIEDIDGII